MSTPQNGFGKNPCVATFVLNGHSPDDVARAAIENGRQKQPFYIFNIDEAYRRIHHFRNMMPRVQIFYAMKSNDSEMMLKLAIALGVGFDCFSPGDIYKIRQLNVCPTSIIYAVTTKTPQQMAYARDSGIKHTTFDSSYELQKLKENWPDAKLIIRIRVESEQKSPLGEKFGCQFENEAIDLLEEAASLGLQVVGVSFHVGGLCTSYQSYVEGLQKARALFDYEAQAGRGMKIVNFGGGFHSDRMDRIDPVANLVNKALAELFPDSNVQVIAEPGRYLCDSSFTLYCNISNVRRIIKNDKQVNMIYLNDGTYGTIRFSEKWHALSKFKRSTEKDQGILEDTILWGPSCDSLDRVMIDFTVRLPRCMPLDWLIFRTHGAYTITYSTRFSSLEIPLIRPVISFELWNRIKNCAIFKPTDFICDPDISAPLPLTMPQIPPRNGFPEHSHIPTLKI